MSGLPSSSVEDVLSQINADDDKPEVKEDIKGDDKEDKKSEEIELKEDDDEDDDKLDLSEDTKKDKKIKLKEADEDDDESEEEKSEDEEIEIDTPPRKKDITAKYPNFFKEFGWMEKMMYRDRQYTELFGSFDDAKEHHAKAQALDSFEQDLSSGNTERILNSVKKADPKAFNKLIDNYLPVLAKVDREAYIEVTGNVAKHIIREMALEGKNSGEEEYQKAALLLNKFLFGTSTYTPPKARVEDSGDENDEIRKERESLIQERYEATRDDLQTKVDNTLRNTIAEYIDPKGEMSAYVKKNAVNDAIRLLHSHISDDKAFRKNLDKLWESAFSNKFSRDSVDKIRRVYLGRAKPALNSIIRKARAEALKDVKPSSRIEESDSESEEREKPRRESRRDVPPGRPHHQTKKLEMKKGESVSDFFARDD